MTRSSRSCGILLHPTSLPGAYGIGEIGREAHAFADTLAEGGASWWQVLPLGPTGYGDSPYQSLSSFAGNPLMISLDAMREEGWLRPEDIRDPPPFPVRRVEFGPVIEWRTARLHRAAERFLETARGRRRESFDRFCSAEAGWLEDFALFIALKNAAGGRPWTDWAPPLSRRDPEALRQARKDRGREIAHVRVLQFFFDLQWRALRRHAARRGVRFIGDTPIFVAHDSADVWARPDLFALDAEGRPAVVAGVPPDYFSATGQRWGNPLYRWDAHRAEGYAWWIARLRRTLQWVDRVRIDHFRGFAGYWEIPATEPTAIHGRWLPGPGEAFFRALQKSMRRLPILAENLGVITPDVEALRKTFRLPGMRILQFEMGRLLEQPPLRPEDGPVRQVVYTGTHDNDTARGWFTSPPGSTSTQAAESLQEERAAVLDYLGTDGAEIHWDLIRLALRSPARLAVIPLQDALGLGSEGRMNWPGRPDGNWQWRFEWDQWTDGLRARLRALAAECRRIPAGGGHARRSVSP